MTAARQLALSLVREIIAGKRARHTVPDYALRDEVRTAVYDALDALVKDGALTRRPASVNRIPAYGIPDNK